MHSFRSRGLAGERLPSHVQAWPSWSNTGFSRGIGQGAVHLIVDSVLSSLDSDHEAEHHCPSHADGFVAGIGSEATANGRAVGTYQLAAR